ncbi:hypothetical protein [Terasakiella sp.]|uniref:hypothetical protein n=1 Tax=Terasakiella sp. TaxID=2034861 RepID=UPI003AA9383D
MTNKAMFAPMTKQEKQSTPPRKTRKKEEWEPLAVIPANIPAPDPHYQHGKATAEYAYRNTAGELVCLIHRFDLGNGDKEVIPATYCYNGRTGKHQWRWKAPLEPRPIYNAHLLIQYPKAPVILCEGEKAADACQRLLPDHIAVTTMGGSNAGKKANWGTLAKRNVIIWPDADTPGMEYAKFAAKALKLVSAQVSVISPPETVSEGWDAADAENEDWDYKRAISFVGTAQSVEEVFNVDEGQTGAGQDTKPRTGGKRGRSNNTDEEEEGAGRVPQRDLILSLMDTIELWHDKKRTAYASVYINGHWENWPLKSNDFNVWLCGHYYREFGHAPGSQAVTDSLKTMEAEAIHYRPRFPVYRRIGALEDHIYLDLGDESWKAVEIGPKGWRMIERAPVKFIRSTSMAALPEPEAGETIERLHDFINAENDNDFRLMVSWLVAALRPNGPYPILLVNGQQGSAKTTITNFLRQLVDPSTVQGGNGQPSNERDLMVSATNNRVLLYDNVSYIAPWLSDALCRIATGGGYATRELHSDMGECILEANCPMILNGIPDLVSRPDFGDRSIFIELPTISEKQRRSKREVDQIFKEAHPGVLGALLDAVSCALRNIDHIKLEDAPRMIDFVEWITAAEPGLGWEPYSFIHIFKQNKDNAIRATAEDDPLIQAILSIADEGGFKGTAAALMERINGYVSEPLRRSSSWPKSPTAMGTAMRRVTPTLRILGVHAEKGKIQGNRHWIINKNDTE